jgi:hypothetical protein
MHTPFWWEILVVSLSCVILVLLIRSEKRSTKMKYENLYHVFSTLLHKDLETEDLSRAEKEAIIEAYLDDLDDHGDEDYYIPVDTHTCVRLIRGSRALGTKSGAYSFLLDSLWFEMEGSIEYLHREYIERRRNNEES